MLRVVVYGSGGVGKSTFASELACRSGAAHVEIDLLAYDLEGVHVPQELLRRRFEDAVLADGWVVEGMHRDQLYRALELAGVFVWLDYPKRVVARRLLGRLFRQVVLRHERHGRKTTIRSAREHELPFVRKTLRSYGHRRAHAEALGSMASSLGVRVERVTLPRTAKRLLNGLVAERSVP